MKNKNLKECIIPFFTILFLITLLLVFIMPNISAIGLGPGKYAVVFSPGASQTFGFTALNNADIPAIYKVYVKGELKDYMICSIDSISLQAGETGRFSCTLTMPAYLEPGAHQISVGIIESASGGGQIAVLSAVESRLTVNVPYPDFFVSIGIWVNNIKINEPTNITVQVKNWGQKNITLQIPIEIMSGGEIIETVLTDEKFIESMKEETFKVVWVASVSNAGKYTAVIKSVEDNQNFNASTSFLVGDLILNIINLTSEIYPGEIGRFDLRLQNMWSEPVDFDVEMSVLKDNKILSSKKDKLSIDGFEEKDFKIFWDTPIQETGDYQAKVKLIYSKNEKELLFNFEVKEREERKSISMGFIFGLAAILVIIIAVVLFFFRRGITKKSRKN